MPTARLPRPPLVTGTTSSTGGVPAALSSWTYSRNIPDVDATAAWALGSSVRTARLNRRPSITSVPISNIARRAGSYRWGKLTKFRASSIRCAWQAISVSVRRIASSSRAVASPAAICRRTAAAKRSSW
ncbi:MAG: hypothetical protein ACOC95_06445 [Planctomycetota bacterium]